MLVFDKAEIRNSLTTDNIFDLLQEWGGDPEYASFGILCATICHNMPGEGSKKLYYYDNSGLFRCYTGCDSYFDIFEMVIKIMKIQHDKDFDLNDAVRWIAQKFNISGTYEDDEESDLEDLADAMHNFPIILFPKNIKKLKLFWKNNIATYQKKWDKNFLIKHKRFFRNIKYNILN